jgi:hypothetical protein
MYLCIHTHADTHMHRYIHIYIQIYKYVWNMLIHTHTQQTYPRTHTHKVHFFGTIMRNERSLFKYADMQRKKRMRKEGNIKPEVYIRVGPTRSGKTSYVYKYIRPLKQSLITHIHIHTPNQTKSYHTYSHTYAHSNKVLSHIFTYIRPLKQSLITHIHIHTLQNKIFWHIDIHTPTKNWILWIYSSAHTCT